MGLNQPEAVVTLPEKLQQAIELGQNKVTILENETKRLARLATQIKTEMASDQLAKDDLNKQIKELYKVKEGILVDIERLKAEKQGLEAYLLATSEEIKAERANIAQEQEKLATAKFEHNDRVFSIGLREEKLKKSEEKLKKDLEDFEIKRSKLLKALE